MTDIEYKHLFEWRENSLKKRKRLFQVHPNMLFNCSVDEDKIYFCPTFGYQDTKLLAVESAGKTLPDPDYYVKRNGCYYYILEFVLSGKGYLYSDGQYYTLEKNNAYLLRPNSDHIYFSDQNDPYEKIWFNFYCGSIEPFLQTLQNDRTVFKNVSCADKFLELYNMLLECNTRDYGKDYGQIYSPSNYNGIYLNVVKTLFDILFCLTNDNIEQTPQSIEHTLKNILDSSIYQKINLQDIARSLLVTQQTLNYKFKKAYGITPYQYYSDLKIEESKKLLLSGLYSLDNISEKLCFPDAFYFSNVFKQKTGMRPSAFVKAHGKPATNLN